MKHNTRGQIEISFNWIFVLIVGAVFLIFFFSLITSSSESSDKKVTTYVAKQFETVLTTTQQEPGTFKTYVTSPIIIDFVCDATEDVYYYAISGKQQRQLKPDIIFAPEHLETNRFYTWTQAWEAPYEAANFMYLATKENAFIFANTTSWAMEEFLIPYPTNFSTFYISPGDIPVNIKYDSYTYVFFAEQWDEFDGMLTDEVFVNEKNVKIIVIDPIEDSLPFSRGTIYFFKPDDLLSTITDSSTLPALNQVPYLSRASIYGAIFSDTPEYYQCTMDKAFDRLQLITLLNYYRVQNELKIVASGSNCEFLLRGAGATTAGMEDHLEGYNQTIAGVPFTIMNPSQIDSLYITYIQPIMQKNNRLSFETQCPLLY